MKAKLTKTPEQVATLLASAVEQDLSFDTILLDPAMGYRDVSTTGIPDLIASLKQQGLINPLIIWNGSETAEGATLSMEGETKKVTAAILVAGRRRYEAIKQLRKTEPKAFEKIFPGGKIHCRVVSGTRADMIVVKIVENLQRENPDGPEMMADVLTLRDDFGMKGADIAKRVGKTGAWVSAVLAVKEELGQEGVDALKAGEISTRDAIAAARTVRKAGGAKTEAGKKAATAGLSAAKAKRTANKAEGRIRSARRVTPAGVYARYQAIAGMKVPLGQRVVILEQALAYLAEKTQKLPAELSADSATTDGTEAKKPAAAKKVAAPAKAKKVLKPAAPKKVAKKVAKPAAKK